MKKSHVIVLSVIITVVVAFASSVATLIGAGLYYYQDGKLFSTPGVSSGQMAEGEGYDYSLLDEVANAIEEIALKPVTAEMKEEMILDAAKGMVYGTGDAYAYLFTPEEFADMMQDSEGIYVGIGVLVQQDLENGLVEVIRVYEDTPAQEAGIKQGDYFYEIDGENVAGYDISQVKALVVGEEGTSVQIRFLRGNDYVDYTVERREVTVHRVQYQMVDGDIAYIAIDSFEGDADELFEQAVEELVKQQGAKGMILDLRSNPGGDKDIVLNIADILLPPGPAMITEDQDGNRQTDSTTSEELGIPLVVLINDTSASASELLSGNIKDYGVGTLVGVNTYGKGTVQTFQMLSDGSVLKLTTYEYLTGKGTRVQDVGVAPDIVVEPTEALENDYEARLTQEDNQYQVALQTVRELIAATGN